VRDSDSLFIADSSTGQFDPSRIIDHFQAKTPPWADEEDRAAINFVRDEQIKFARMHYDAWNRADNEIGHTKAAATAEEAWDTFATAEDAIIKTAPRSIAGAIAKLRYAHAATFDYRTIVAEDQAPEVRVLAEVIDFLEQLLAGSAVAS
jgi:hypothetical protein